MGEAGPCSLAKLRLLSRVIRKGLHEMPSKEWLNSSKEDPNRGWEYADFRITEDGEMYRWPVA